MPVADTDAPPVVSPAPGILVPAVQGEGDH